MDAPESPRRRWFDRPAILIPACLAIVVAFVASFVAWKWAQAVNRAQVVDELHRRGAVAAVGYSEGAWSTDWPFCNVKQMAIISLRDGQFSKDDVYRLRAIFPGVPLAHTDAQNNVSTLIP